MPMEKLGLGLATFAFAALTFLMPLVAIHGIPPIAKAPLALALLIAFSGLILAATSLRRRLPWTRLILFLMLIVILTTELLYNPRCWVVLDPNQHGCHSPMIAIVLGAVGLALSR